MEKQDEHLKSEKKHYEPPKAEFIPLKTEERLLACGKEEACTVFGGFRLVLTLGQSCGSGGMVS
jgi:hypothetical protein